MSELKHPVNVEHSWDWVLAQIGVAILWFVAFLVFTKPFAEIPEFAPFVNFAKYALLAVLIIKYVISSWTRTLNEKLVIHDDGIYIKMKNYTNDIPWEHIAAGQVEWSSYGRSQNYGTIIIQTRGDFPRIKFEGANRPMDDIAVMRRRVGLDSWKDNVDILIEPEDKDYFQNPR